MNDLYKGYEPILSKQKLLCTSFFCFSIFYSSKKILDTHSQTQLNFFHYNYYGKEKCLTTSATSELTTIIHI